MHISSLPTYLANQVTEIINLSEQIFYPEQIDPDHLGSHAANILRLVTEEGLHQAEEADLQTLLSSLQQTFTLRIAQERLSFNSHHYAGMAVIEGEYNYSKELINIVDYKAIVYLVDPIPAEWVVYKIGITDIDYNFITTII